MTNFDHNQILEELKKLFLQVAPEKINGEITVDSDLIVDFAFDSVELTHILQLIKERYLNDEDDIMYIINMALGTDEFADGVLVGKMCKMIMDLNQKAELCQGE